MRSRVATRASTNRGDKPVARLSHARRYAEIVAVFVKYGFVDVVRALHLTPYLHAGRRMLAAAGRPVTPDANKAQRFRQAQEALGPTFIKLGQALSTRRIFCRRIC